ncbi:MAG: hypothetical protein IJN50_07745 [Clostridia bacterium]|nr:hypothetical protein [Clostridia bacterium]
MQNKRKKLPGEEPGSFFLSIRIAENFETESHCAVFILMIEVELKSFIKLLSFINIRLCTAYLKIFEEVFTFKVLHDFYKAEIIEIDNISALNEIIAFLFQV